MADEIHEDEPTYVISVAARLVQMHPQTLRYYERAGLIQPTRSRGRIRLYSQRDIERLRKIARLTEDLGVNLAGVEVILNLTERLEVIQHELEKHQIRLESDYTVENYGADRDAERAAPQSRAPRTTAKNRPDKSRRAR